MEMYTAHVTDVGQKKTNQDSLMVTRVRDAAGPFAFTAVCDGMGGYEKGELASAEVVKAFDGWFGENMADLAAGRLDPGQIRASWKGIVAGENNRLRNYGQEKGVRLGTTAACALILRDKYYILNVGDSRVYQITGAGAKILTRDQTLVMREVEAGRLAYEDMERDPRRSILLQCIGAMDSVEIEFYTGNIEENSVFMVCSDGFRHLNSQAEIGGFLNPAGIFSEEELGARLVQLMRQALARGEKDNVTASAVLTRL